MRSFFELIDSNDIAFSVVIIGFLAVFAISFAYHWNKQNKKGR